MYERRNKYLERRQQERNRSRGSMPREDYRDYRYDEPDFRRYDRMYYPEYDGRYDYARSSKSRDRYDRMDREYDRQYSRYIPYEPDYASEKRYEEDLKDWENKLKKYDRFKVSKEQIINQAKNMGINFEEFSEEEFYTTYLMMVSDYKTIANDYNIYIKLAQDFLNDEDSELKGSEKLCAYMYEIVLDK